MYRLEVIKMSIFQIVASLFALFMIYTVTLYSKKRTLGPAETSFWITVWTFFIILAIFPDLLLGISRQLKFARVFDLLLVGGLMILSVISFYNYLRHKALEMRIETFIREQALAEKKHDKKAA